MPPQQSDEFEKVYQKAHLKVQYAILPSSIHGGKKFYDQQRFSILQEFLKVLTP